MLKKKFVQSSMLLLASVLLLCSLIPTASAASMNAAPREVKLEWNGTRLPQNGLLIEGSTMIPVVLLRDSIGVTLRYEPTVKTYTLLQNDDQIDMIMGTDSINIRLNNHQWKGPNAQVINGRLYIPFTVLRDGFGYQSAWNASQVKLNFAKKGIFLEE
ncbi:copper amine oxidase N-terminal domain-containing protein [Paenibacillus hunanensis]|uniref:stalk domain-containing protein n=1 Tax=Paenibacillus hunanensis TaxID=539262 RepID=UPI0020273E3E|nr:stalk domain-containing protein [Paenibacillus hunanensis]MCL9663478.1 copper amine oxidase N-terminal domain-containing protein [Paenibacillus hunanensis]